MRPAKPSDNFPENVDAGAPDLSLMAKARAVVKTQSFRFTDHLWIQVINQSG